MGDACPSAYDSTNGLNGLHPKLSETKICHLVHLSRWDLSIAHCRSLRWLPAAWQPIIPALAKTFCVNLQCCPDADLWRCGKLVGSRVEAGMLREHRSCQATVVSLSGEHLHKSEHNNRIPWYAMGLSLSMKVPGGMNHPISGRARS